MAGDGKHGSIMLSPGRVRSRNDMLCLVRIAVHRVESEILVVGYQAAAQKRTLDVVKLAYAGATGW